MKIPVSKNDKTSTFETGILRIWIILQINLALYQRDSRTAYFNKRLTVF